MRSLFDGHGLGLLGLTLICACSSGGDSGALEVTSGDMSVEVDVDKRGAVLELENRVRLTIPEGALAERTTIRVESRDLAELPARPERGFTDLESPVVIEPHGLRLSQPATIELAVRDDSTDDGSLRVLRLEDERDDTWEPLETRVVRAGEPRSDDSPATGEDTLASRRRTEVRVETFSVFLVAATELVAGACEGQEAGTECRPSRGPCDPAETCDGESPDCPADAVSEAGTVCREARDACDVAETCDGEGAACPADAFAAAGVACDDDGVFCNGPEQCDGSGSCVSAGDPCAAAVDETDDDCAESCNEEAGDCSAANPDGLACFPSVCAEGLCQSGTCVEQVQCPVFVDARGSDGPGCGSAFGTQACATLQGGSDEAVRSINDRVFVRNELFAASGTAPLLTMADGIAYYGGFEGTENLLSERTDPIAQHTVLDGNGTAGHVVVGAAGARLDGFLVTGGVGAVEGGSTVGAGMYNNATSGLVIANAVFDGNAIAGGSGSPRGAGIFNSNVADLTVENVRFANNVVQNGGNAYGAGMASMDCSVSLTDVEFVANTVSATASATVFGGGLYDENTSSTLSGVTFEANQLIGPYGPRRGAGYAAEGGSFSTTVSNSAFVANVAPETMASSQTQGGGMYVSAIGEGESLELQDVRFEHNTTPL